jgi:hypothetical protein
MRTNDSICEIDAEIEMFTRNTDMSGQVQAAVDAGRSEVTQGSDCFGQVWIVSFEEYGQWRTDVGDQFHNGKGMI